MSLNWLINVALTLPVHNSSSQVRKYPISYILTLISSPKYQAQNKNCDKIFITNGLKKTNWMLETTMKTTRAYLSDMVIEDFIEIKCIAFVLKR